MKQGQFQDLPDEVFKLGAPREVYRRNTKRVVGITLFAVLLSVMGPIVLASCVVSSTDPELRLPRTRLWFGAVGGLLMSASGLWVLVGIVRQRKLRVVVCSDGFARVEARKRVFVCRWDEIEDVLESGRVVTVQKRGGGTITFNDEHDLLNDMTKLACTIVAQSVIKDYKRNN